MVNKSFTNKNSKNQTMKKVLYSLSVLSLLSISCARYDVNRVNWEKLGSSACPSPTYIATMAKSAVDTGGYFNGERITLFELYKDARVIHGTDVTIQNIRYDVKNGKKKVSVIFDVVKCK